jgi:hypothetical protein
MPAKTILFAPAANRKLDGKGKMFPSVFIPVFAGVGAQRGFEVKIVNYPWRFVFGPTIPNVAAIISIYNEELASDIKAARPIEQRADKSYREALFFPRLSVAHVLGNKHATNALLSDVVSMPKLVDAVAQDKVFSNAPNTNGAAVQVLSKGEALDPHRYNTLFVDTLHEYAGKRYFVCLRAMCVGTEMIGVIVRARPDIDGSASVHEKDTPVDAGLLNYLHKKLVEPHREELKKLCQEIGQVLGVGFYAHDILPERDTGKFFLCESNIKFNNRSTQRRLWSIRDELIFAPDFLEPGIRRASEVFFDYLAGDSIGNNAASV